MDSNGMIREELDIKILILFVLSKLSFPIEIDSLSDLCREETGVGYFDFTQCLDDLVENGNILRNEDNEYSISEKGLRNADAVFTSLPYSVRSKVLEDIEPVNEELRRQDMIRASHLCQADGICDVMLSLHDNAGKIMELSFLCADEAQAKTIEKNFKKNAEAIYMKIIGLFDEV